MREAKEAKIGRKEALAKVKRLGICLDTKIFRSLGLREERKGFKKENTLLQAEN